MNDLFRWKPCKMRCARRSQQVINFASSWLPYTIQSILDYAFTQACISLYKTFVKRRVFDIAKVILSQLLRFQIPVDGFGLGWDGVIDFKIIGSTDRRTGLWVTWWKVDRQKHRLRLLIIKLALWSFCQPHNTHLILLNWQILMRHYLNSEYYREESSKRCSKSNFI